jgi:colicin import membrane protein
MNDHRPLREPPRRFLPILLTIAVHLGPMLAYYLWPRPDNSAQPLGSLEVALVSAPSQPQVVQPPEPPPPEPVRPPEPPKPPVVEPPKSVKPEIATKEPKKPEPKPEPKKPEPKPEPKKPEPKKPEPEPKPKPLKPIKPITFDDRLSRETTQIADATKAREALGEGLNAGRPGTPGGVDDAYKRAIADKARRNLSVEHLNLTGNPVVVVRITQILSGEVIKVEVESSSGNPALDDAAVRAIQKSSPLPKPEPPAKPPHDLTLKFYPLAK